MSKRKNNNKKKRVKGKKLSMLLFSKLHLAPYMHILFLGEKISMKFLNRVKMPPLLNVVTFKLVSVTLYFCMII